ncbi:FixH family protein [Agrobacterium sp. rho-13.3]|uniref:FixH family protein n=1 Tax=Agrobacterium sp. rho-13.3 TaxID=3072980 RepID=UPI002A183FF8|nr:FixH family protein [Agrobacterium sp. rho-13.3]MDX8309447.1 FixH family protein [Agrobacterium sp. rho-13.3]
MSAEPREKPSFTFTGWHMLTIMLLFFGTIISVNVTMAWNAVTSWSGLVVQNTYVASQQFNGKAEAAKARAASGIVGKLHIDGDVIAYEVSHPERGAVETDTVTLNFRRPVGEKQDFSLVLEKQSANRFAARHDLAAGDWIVEAIAVKDGKIIVHEGTRIDIAGGVR